MPNLEDNTDEELIEIALNQGNHGRNRQESLSILLTRHYNWIFKMSLAHLKNAQTAQDCTQEIMLQVFNSINNFRFQSKFSTWLYTITKRNILKSKVKRLITLKTESSAIEITTQELIPQDQKNLWQDIIRLPQRQRDIIILHYFEDRSLEQIAEQTMLSVGTVKSHLFKARANLKKYLGECDE